MPSVSQPLFFQPLNKNLKDIMTIKEYEKALQDLINLSKEQAAQFKREIRALKRQLKQKEQEAADPFPIEDDDEKPSAREERLKERMKDNRERVLKALEKLPGKSGSAPAIEEFVQENCISNLMDVDEYTFRALIMRDFNATVEKAYTDRSIPPRIYHSLVRFFDIAADINSLDLDDSIKESAAKLKEQDEEKARLKQEAANADRGEFRLQGRTELEEFFNEHVVDIANHRDLYAKFGVNFPKSFILEGPPGCGKTYAVERLAEFLGWHTQRISAANVGSTFIHDTAKKIEEAFEEATKNAPSILIVDEMDAFMPNRATSGDQHTHVKEEVGSFLKCLQDAEKNQVLVIGMTNLVDTIDPAIMRTGRMGTHLKVDMPSLEEVEAVLRYALEKVPHTEFPLTPYAEKLLDHPLSDVTHAVDCAGMQAARSRREILEEADLAAALDRILERQGAKDKARRPIGFAA